MSETVPHILVVDDETQVRELLLTVMKREGYTVMAAGDAAKALEFLGRDHVDLILLDLHMPGPADGEDLLFLLRDRGDDVPIVIVSGYVDDEVTVNLPDCVHAVMKKPIRIEELVETVKQVLAN